MILYVYAVCRTFIHVNAQVIDVLTSKDLMPLQ